MQTEHEKEQLIIIHLFPSKTQREVQSLIYLKHHRRHISVHQEPPSGQLQSLDTVHISVCLHYVLYGVTVTGRMMVPGEPKYASYGVLNK
jgi:hypothetical protein